MNAVIFNERSRREHQNYTLLDFFKHNLNKSEENVNLKTMKLTDLCEELDIQDVHIGEQIHDNLIGEQMYEAPKLIEKVVNELKVGLSEL